MTYRDLVPGTCFLAWAGQDGLVKKAVVFPYVGLPFADVREDDWFYQAVVSAVNQGLMKGTGDRAFSPDGSMTRAQAVRALYQMAGSPAVTAAVPEYTDFSGRDDMTALAWAAGCGIVRGYSDGTFRLDAAVTREQFAVLLYRWVREQGGGFQGNWMFLLDYPDRDRIAGYAYESVAWCTMQGILTGRSDGTLAPDEPVSRAAAAVMLQRCQEWKKI